MKKVIIIALVALGAVACKSSLQQQLEQIARQANSACPIQITYFLSLDAFAAEPGEVLRLDYTTSSPEFDVAYARSDDNKRVIAQMLGQAAENNPLIMQISYHAVYHTPDGEVLAEITITPDDVERFKAEDSEYAEFIAELKADIAANPTPDKGVIRYELFEDKKTLLTVYLIPDNEVLILADVPSSRLKDNIIRNTKHDAAKWGKTVNILRHGITMDYLWVNSENKLINSCSIVYDDLKPQL